MTSETAPKALMDSFCALHNPLKAFGYQLFQAAIAGDPSIVDSIGDAMSRGDHLFIAFDALPNQNGLFTQASLISIRADGHLSHHLALKLLDPHPIPDSTLEAGNV